MGIIKRELRFVVVMLMFIAMPTLALHILELEYGHGEIAFAVLTGMAVAGIAIYINMDIQRGAASSKLKVFWNLHFSSLEEESGVYTYGMLRDTIQNLLAVYPIAASARKGNARKYMELIHYLQRVTRTGGGQVPRNIENEARDRLRRLAADALHPV
ncbi:MAG: hypothetical protein MPJ08_01180 [Nitrosopumilus sp.]|nr:hypothetical protein [Nitrosopumilus sp.]